MFAGLFDFFERYVLPELEDYYEAEKALSQAFSATKDIHHCREHADKAIRRTCTAAIAFDGLIDRVLSRPAKGARK